MHVQWNLEDLRIRYRHLERYCQLLKICGLETAYELCLESLDICKRMLEIAEDYNILDLIEEYFDLELEVLELEIDSLNIEQEYRQDIEIFEDSYQSVELETLIRRRDRLYELIISMISE